MSGNNSNNARSVLLLGPGFIGRHVIDLLVGEHCQVTTIVRRPEYIEALEASGASTVPGKIDDKALVTAQSYKHDIIIHTASADHPPSVEAVLDAIRQRASEGRSTIFIHTSGTSVLDDGADGEFKTEKVFSDTSREEVDSVPDQAPHRSIDLMIIRAQEQLGERAKLAIMIPPLIYGYNPAHDRLSIQIPTLTRFALKHGYSTYMGTGAAVESSIHVSDLARAYMVLLHHMEQSSANSLLDNPYYFCETTGDNEPSWKEISDTIGEALHAAGRIQSPVPKVLPKELYGDVFGDDSSPIIGLNSRSRAERLRALGWQPREKDWKRSYLEDELPVLLREDISGFKGYMTNLTSR